VYVCMYVSIVGLSVKYGLVRGLKHGNPMRAGL
jgi:hypothetical protein